MGSILIKRWIKKEWKWSTDLQAHQKWVRTGSKVRPVLSMCRRSSRSWATRFVFEPTNGSKNSSRRPPGVTHLLHLLHQHLGAVRPDGCRRRRNHQHRLVVAPGSVAFIWIPCLETSSIKLILKKQEKWAEETGFKIRAWTETANLLFQLIKLQHVNSTYETAS